MQPRSEWKRSGLPTWKDKMITAKEATDLIKDLAQDCLIPQLEIIPFQQSHNRVLAENIHATYDQPPFDRVSMDGIALSFEILKNNNILEIEGIQQAGQEAIRLIHATHCIEVMTGAPLPMGCDTVIPYEVLNLIDKTAMIQNPSDVKRGQNIHARASDYKKNSLLISRGTIINSGHLSIIASCGLKDVKVHTTPKIAIVSTGDELVEPGNLLLPHQIFRSNPYALNAILSDHNITNTTMGHLPDNQEKMIFELKNILNSNQIIVLTGGVSKGKFDFLPSVLADLGVKQIFHKVRHRPGMPLLFGVGPQNQLFFGLPGNPVSSVVNLRRYVIPVIKESFKPTMYVKIAEELRLKKDMTFFIPAKLEFSNDAIVLAHSILVNGSGDFFSLRDSDGFLEIENLDNKNTFPAGSILPFYHWKYI